MGHAGQKQDNRFKEACALLQRVVRMETDQLGGAEIEELISDVKDFLKKKGC